MLNTSRWGKAFKQFSINSIASWQNYNLIPCSYNQFSFSTEVEFDYRVNCIIIARTMLKHAEMVLFFKAFFPQLVSGPIVKAHDFLPQIKPKMFKAVRWEYCFRKLILGYFLKMVIADNLKDHTFTIAYPYFENMSSLTLVVLLFGYSIQIFADFAGYSLIASGLASLLGYQFPINFNFPYVSSSFSDFWRRWHISLSSFLRDYLYIPLGGNRHGVTRTYLNLLLTYIIVSPRSIPYYWLTSRYLSDKWRYSSNSARNYPIHDLSTSSS